MTVEATEPSGWATLAAQQGFPDLCLAHLRELREDSGIADDVIRARGYRTIMREREINRVSEEISKLRRMGFGNGVTDTEAASLWPALFLPIYNAAGRFAGTGQLKPWQPRKNAKGKPRKYESPSGKSASLDLHPFHKDRVADPRTELWVTEGIKKADSLTSRLGETAAVVALSGVFNWRDRVKTLGDWESVALRGREVTICFDSDTEQNHQVADAMRRLGMWFRSRGAEKVWYVTPPEEVDGRPTKGVDDFFVAGGTIEAIRERRQPRPITVAIDDGFTDRTIAQQVVSEGLGEILRFAPGMGWLMWNGSIWEAVPEERVRGLLGVWLDEKLRQAVQQARYGRGDSVKEWHAVRSAGKARSICYWLAELLLADPAEFDTDPDMLNCVNGVVDLATGELLDHSPDRYMTKTTGVPYIKDAVHADWSKALEALPAEAVPWFQLRVGQSATGHMDPTARLLILQSGGSSGKSTILAALKSVLGTYAIQLDDNVLIQRDTAKNSSASPEMVALQGARFAYMEETPESAQINDVRLKKIIGTPEITGRDLFRSTITFRNSTTIMLSTNFPPKVARSDHGTWRRLALLKFPYTYKPAEACSGRPDERVQDIGLIGRVEHDPEVHQAVLAWIVAGATAWYAEGGPRGTGDGSALNRLPAVVLASTEKWREETDHISRFVGESVKFDPDKWVPVAEVRARFNLMLEADGHRPLGQVEFGRRFVAACSSAGVAVEAVAGRPSGFPGDLAGYGGTAGLPPGNPMIRVYYGVSLSADSGFMPGLNA